MALSPSDQANTDRDVRLALGKLPAAYQGIRRLTPSMTSVEAERGEYPVARSRRLGQRGRNGTKPGALAEIVINLPPIGPWASTDHSPMLPAQPGRNIVDHGLHVWMLVG